MKHRKIKPLGKSRSGIKNKWHGYDALTLFHNNEVYSGLINTSPIQNRLVAKHNYIPFEDETLKPFKAIWMIEDSKLLLGCVNGIFNDKVYFTLDLVPEYPDNTIEFHYAKFSGEIKFTVQCHEFGLFTNKFKNGRYQYLSLKIKNGILINIEDYEHNVSNKNIKPPKLILNNNNDILKIATNEFPIDQVLNEDKITPWLNSYVTIFQEFHLPPLWNLEEMYFYNLYSRLKTLIEYYNLKELAQIALDDFTPSTNKKEYLSKYEQLGNQLVLIDLDLAHLPNRSPNMKYLINNGTFVTVSELGLKPQMDFKKHYWKVFGIIYPD